MISEKFLVYTFNEKGFLIPAAKREFNSRKEADDYIRSRNINGMVVIKKNPFNIIPRENINLPK